MLGDQAKHALSSFLMALQKQNAQFEKIAEESSDKLLVVLQIGIGSVHNVVHKELGFSRLSACSLLRHLQGLVGPP